MLLIHSDCGARPKSTNADGGGQTSATVDSGCRDSHNQDAPLDRLSCTMVPRPLIAFLIVALCVLLVGFAVLVVRLCAGRRSGRPASRPRPGVDRGGLPAAVAGGLGAAGDRAGTEPSARSGPVGCRTVRSACCPPSDGTRIGSEPSGWRTIPLPFRPAGRADGGGARGEGGLGKRAGREQIADLKPVLAALAAADHVAEAGTRIDQLLTENLAHLQAPQQIIFVAQIGHPERTLGRCLHRSTSALAGRRGHTVSPTGCGPSHLIPARKRQRRNAPGDSNTRASPTRRRPRARRRTHRPQIPAAISSSLAP